MLKLSIFACQSRNRALLLPPSPRLATLLENTKNKRQMKLTNINKLKKNKGLTLIELTVVILVLLSLVSILFVGAKAWKKGSDRAANILNIRNSQVAMRSYQNMNNKEVGDVIAETEIFGAGKFFENKPIPPVSSGETSYTFASAIPAIGELYVTNSNLTSGEWFYTEANKTADW